MTVRKTLIVVSMLLVSAVASAAPQGIVASAPIPLQIENHARANGAWGGNTPKLRLWPNKAGTHVSAAVSSLTYSSTARKVVRQTFAKAKFDITRSASGGRFIKPVLQHGNVWQFLAVALGAR